MSDEKKVVTLPDKAESKAESEYLVRFSWPYSFEGEDFQSIDLAGLLNLSSEDIFEASRQVFNDYILPRPEVDPKYCCIVAALACKRPPEFFFGLPAKDMLKVRNKVQSFFLGED